MKSFILLLISTLILNAQVTNIITGARFSDVITRTTNYFEVITKQEHIVSYTYLGTNYFITNTLRTVIQPIIKIPEPVFIINYSERGTNYSVTNATSR